MPRQARLDVPGALHHIMVRGINKSTIFDDDQDRTQFLKRLGENVTTAHASVYAWVLMTNHVHILLKSGKHGISAVMRKQLTWYAQYYNRRHGRTGHLFGSAAIRSKEESMNGIDFFRRTIFLLTAVVMLFQFSGCATGKARPAAINQFTDFAIVVDSTVIEGRSAKKDLISVPQNLAISEKIGEAAAGILKDKGYKVNDAHLYSAGALVWQPLTVALDEQKAVDYQPQVQKVLWRSASEESDIKPPFAAKPEVNDEGRRSIRNFFNTLFPLKSGEDAHYVIAKTPLPINGKTVLAIRANGKVISNAAVAGNVAQALMLPVLILGRSGGGGDFSKKDNLGLTAYIVDMDKGEVLWTESIYKTKSPEGDNFIQFIQKVLEKLPPAGDRFL